MRLNQRWLLFHRVFQLFAQWGGLIILNQYLAQNAWSSLKTDPTEK